MIITLLYRLLARFTTCASLAMLPLVRGAASEPARQPAAIVATFCAACHGSNLTGGAGPNLLDSFWNHGAEPADIARSIRDGWWVSRMPPFKSVLTEPEIQGVVAFIQDQHEEFRAGRVVLPPAPPDQTFRSEKHIFRVETIVSNLEIPWGIAFLPDGSFLVSERPGRLRLVVNGKLQPEPIQGTPRVFFRQDGGMLDVIAHPDYATNGWIYLAYSEAGPIADTSMTVVVRGRVRDGRWIDQQDVFRASGKFYQTGYVHYGCRFLFDDDGHLFFTIGDRGRWKEAQDLDSPLGKIHRVLDDGRVPRDNPFVDRPDALGSIWSLGHRHPQGLVRHPATRELWAAEHGPDAGDELNRIEPGRNHGWPIVSDGTDRLIKFAGRHREGMERPVTSWTPTIAPSAIAFYAGDRFAGWRNDLLVTSLLTERLLRLEIAGETVVHEETLFAGLGRVRDVTTGPDGLIYVSLEGPGRIVRLVPVE
jgi:glucose/arabinose dehydrogenase